MKPYFPNPFRPHTTQLSPKSIPPLLPLSLQPSTGDSKKEFDSPAPLLSARSQEGVSKYSLHALASPPKVRKLKNPQASHSFKGIPTEAGTPKSSVFSGHIPAMLNLTHGSSERPETLKIFKTKIEAIKEADELSQASANEKRTMGGGGHKIKRADSIRTIKLLLEQGKKEEAKKKKGKLRGSMYVNDLWAHGYEQNVMKAIHIEKELKKDNGFMKKPLVEIFRELTNAYEKKAKKHETSGTLKDVWQQKTLEQIPGTMGSFQWDGDNSDDESGSPKGQQTSGGQTGQQKTKLSTFSRRIDDLEREGSVSPDFHRPTRKRTSSVPNAFQGEFLSARPKQLEKIMLSPRETDNRMKSPTNQSTMKFINATAASPLSLSTKISQAQLPSVTKKRRVNVLKISSPKAINGVKGFEASSKGSLGRGTMGSPLGFYTEETRRSRLDTQVEMLIEKCNTELDEGHEYKEVIETMQGILEKKKKDFKKKFNEEKKERVIKNCQYMLDRRDAKAK